MKTDINFFKIRNGLEVYTCPLCGNKLDGCHIGSYCSKCPYVDGYA